DDALLVEEELAYLTVDAILSRSRPEHDQGGYEESDGDDDRRRHGRSDLDCHDHTCDHQGQDQDEEGPLRQASGLDGLVLDSEGVLELTGEDDRRLLV